MDADFGPNAPTDEATPAPEPATATPAPELPRTHTPVLKFAPAMDLGSDIASDSEDGAVSTRDIEYEATSPSLSEGEEGGWNLDSDQEVWFGLAVDSRAQALIQAGSCRHKCLEGKEDKIERFITSAEL
ncbi:hypothetical protein GN244_ATG08873 [Phytophthora infestans]|uniref:Uncharacterized protein n=1 Tax=Phytophthora infestans TaxID=4787 RepID=A0A833S2L5_PHYIN|nr:hypothetical protein GN244_ATG08873 [Phytophthora infestans]